MSLIRKWINLSIIFSILHLSPPVFFTKLGKIISLLFTDEPYILSLYLCREHRDDTILFILCDLTPFLLIQANWVSWVSFSSDMVVLLHVFLGRCFFIFPWGFNTFAWYGFLCGFLINLSAFFLVDLLSTWLEKYIADV